MNCEQWNILESILNRTNTSLYSGLIVDSPWMPGYCGVSNLDFYIRNDCWFNSYLRIKRDFPDLLLLPDWWCEYGMAAEPSGYGCKIGFSDNNLPIVYHIAESLEDFQFTRLHVPNPRTDGFMPFLLNFQKYMKPRIQEYGEDYYIVSARGPLTIASHLMPLTEFLVGCKTDKDSIHKLLKNTTETCKRWLNAQMENIGTAKGIMILDDVTGFLSESDFLEFSYPYLKDVFDSFPEMKHLFHNDATSTTSYPYLSDMGVDLFNMTHKTDIADVLHLTGGKVVLLGNVPPMSTVNLSPENVAEETTNMINNYIKANLGDYHGLLVSTGGGAPMGAKGENIQAMIDAVKSYRI